jgi:hypothetical protein
VDLTSLKNFLEHVLQWDFRLALVIKVLGRERMLFGRKRLGTLAAFTHPAPWLDYLDMTAN